MLRKKNITEKLKRLILKHLKVKVFDEAVIFRQEKSYKIRNGQRQQIYSFTLLLMLLSTAKTAFTNEAFMTGHRLYNFTRGGN